MYKFHTVQDKNYKSDIRNILTIKLSFRVQIILLINIHCKCFVLCGHYCISRLIQFNEKIKLGK